MENKSEFDYKPENEENVRSEKTGEQNPGKEKTRPFDYAAYKKSKRNRGNLIGGFVLIVMGGLFLMENLIPGFRFWDYWPVILIVAGIGMIIGAFE